MDRYLGIVVVVVIHVILVYLVILHFKYAKNAKYDKNQGCQMKPCPSPMSRLDGWDWGAKRA